MELHLPLVQDRQEESKSENGNQNIHHMEGANVQHIQASQQSPFVRSVKSQSFGSESSRLFSLSDCNSLRVAARETKINSCKPYSLSPVATAEYIRSQMREGSPSLICLGKDVQRPDRKVDNSQRRSSVDVATAEYIRSQIPKGSPSLTSLEKNIQRPDNSQRRSSVDVATAEYIRSQIPKGSPSLTSLEKNVQRPDNSQRRLSVYSCQSMDIMKGDVSVTENPTTMKLQYNRFGSNFQSRCNDMSDSELQMNASTFHTNQDPFGHDMTWRNSAHLVEVRSDRCAAGGKQFHRDQLLDEPKRQVRLLCTTAEQKPGSEVLTGIREAVPQSYDLSDAVMSEGKIEPSHDVVNSYIACPEKVLVNSHRNSRCPPSVVDVKDLSFSDMTSRRNHGDFRLDLEQLNARFDHKLSSPKQTRTETRNANQSGYKKSKNRADFPLGRGIYKQDNVSPFLSKLTIEVSPAQCRDDRSTFIIKTEPFPESRKIQEQAGLRRESYRILGENHISRKMTLSKFDENLAPGSTYATLTDFNHAGRQTTAGLHQNRLNQKLMSGSSDKNEDSNPGSLNSLLIAHSDTRSKMCLPGFTHGSDTGSQMSLVPAEFSTGPEERCPSMSFVTSTPLREPNKPVEVLTTICIENTDTKQIEAAATNGRESQIQIICSEEKHVQIQQNNTMGILDTITTDQLVGVSGKETRTLMEDEVKKVEGHITDVPKVYNISASKPVGGLSLQNEEPDSRNTGSRTRQRSRIYNNSALPVVNKFDCSTPPWTLNISPIIPKGLTDVHKRAQSEKTKSGPAPRSAPDMRRHCGFNTGLKPVNLFSEYIPKKDQEGVTTCPSSLVSEQNSGSVTNIRRRCMDGMNTRTTMTDGILNTYRKQMEAVSNNNSSNSKLQADGYFKVASNTRRLSDIPFSLSTHPRKIFSQQFKKRDSSIISNTEDSHDKRFSDFQRKCPGYLFRADLVPAKEHNRRNSLGVIRMKSADIAAIYSKINYSALKTNCQHEGTAEQAQRTGELSDNTFKYPVVLDEFNIDSRLPKTKNDHEPAIEYFRLLSPTCESKHQERKPIASCQQTLTKIELDPEGRMGQHFECQEEEFCSAEVFLENLQNSSIFAYSPSACRDYSKNTPASFTRNSRDNSNTYLVDNGTKQGQTINPWDEPKSRYNVAYASQNGRQSLPAVTSHKVKEPGFENRRLTQQTIPGHGTRHALHYSAIAGQAQIVAEKPIRTGLFCQTRGTCSKTDITSKMDNFSEAMLPPVDKPSNPQSFLTAPRNMSSNTIQQTEARRRSTIGVMDINVVTLEPVVIVNTSKTSEPTNPESQEVKLAGSVAEGTSLESRASQAGAQQDWNLLHANVQDSVNPRISTPVRRPRVAKIDHETANRIIERPFSPPHQSATTERSIVSTSRHTNNTFQRNTRDNSHMHSSCHEQPCSEAWNIHVKSANTHAPRALTRDVVRGTILNGTASKCFRETKDSSCAEEFPLDNNSRMSDQERSKNPSECGRIIDWTKAEDHLSSSKNYAVEIQNEIWGSSPVNKLRSQDGNFSSFDDCMSVCRVDNYNECEDPDSHSTPDVYAQAVPVRHHVSAGISGHALPSESAVTTCLVFTPQTSSTAPVIKSGHARDTVSRDQTSTSRQLAMMERQKGPTVRNRNIFKGSVFISLLVESHPRHFPSRAVACRLARRLFREGHIRSISVATDFEDSAQLYVWHDEELTPQGRELSMTSPTITSPSNSNSRSNPEKKPHRQVDWQLIQDIRNKLLNRSEAYNIVTSYNTFFQELEQDFGHKQNKSPTRGSGIGWECSNAPFTSTLEFKKDTVHSTDSSLDNQNYLRKLKNSDKTRKKNTKHTSVSAHSKIISAKDTSSKSQVPSSHLNKQHSKQIHQHSYNNKHPARQTTAPTMNKEPTGNMNNEHTVNYEDRLSNTNLNLEQPHLTPSDPIMEYGDRSHQQGGIVTDQRSSAAVEHLGNKSRNVVEPGSTANSDRGNRWPLEPFNQQLQPGSLEMQKWLSPGASYFSGSQGWVSENNRSKPESGLVGASRSRWPDSVTSDGIDSGRRWPESTYSYSDNEKQLLEEMRRMRKEHQNVLRTYEGRINKLMAKMHELRNIAEMLEQSSSKSSPYGIMGGKLALLNILGGKTVDGRATVADKTDFETDQLPPPLPPRPGRGSRVYPNKPIIHTSVAMKPLLWSRIILETDHRGEQACTVWHDMTEPKIDTEQLQRLFSGSYDVPSDVNLYDDICLRRGRNQSQLVSIYEAEKSQRIASELQALRCTLPEVIQAFLTFNCDGLHTDSFAELLELLTSPRELDKIFQHVKRRGAGQLDAPEYLVFELSKVDHFRERLEFLRFKNKIQINLFEIDQQLRELQTACEEMTSSIALKHVLETVLAVGNHMNAGTDRGQADGFRVDVLNTLKDMQDLSKQCNLLELIMRTYCLKFECDLDFGCPTRFRLPEPSNMRHAAQVSFEDIQRALRELEDELSVVRNKLESLSKQEGSTLTIALKVTCENFMSSAMEVLAEEQKLLEDTRVQFWKTASYFSYDGQRSTPHEFFQVWASFLHDCKYYWKLAHRNLAKAKFNSDLATKSQLSCSSLPGFNSLKSAMMKHVASFRQDEDMRTSKSHQLKHISSWIQSLGKYTLDMQPEGASSSPDTKDVAGHHAGALPGHARKSQQHQEPEQGSSSPNKNQTSTEPRNNVNSITDLGRHFEQESKSVLDNVRTMHSNNSRYNALEIPQVPSSPKPIKAIPPNVIKPQPTVRTSPSTSSILDLAKPPSLVSYQSNVPNVKDTHRHNNAYHNDNFGFEPLYECLPHFSPDSADLQLNDAPDSSQAGFASSGNTLSPDPDNTQRKNSKFFKSLLKRDQKRHHINENSPHGTPTSPLKSMSAPFSKVKNTFAQKFSGSGNIKNSNKELLKHYNHSNVNPVIETSNKPSQQPLLDHEAMSYCFSDRDTAHFDNSRGHIADKDHVNYQNLYFPDPPRQSENFRYMQTPKNLEVYPDHHEQIYFRDGHESFPSTISSLQSIRDKGKSNYQGNILHRRDNTNQQDTIQKYYRDDSRDPDKPAGKYSTDNIDGSPSSQARVRAPIALGSNMSISDVYGKGTENAQTQTSENYGFQSPHTGSSGINQERCSSVSNGAAQHGLSESKLVKASPVPVYKAKLIPNYENQSKYDPRFEGGVRGKAEAVIQTAHVPQVSISSDMYREELQKKSEQYVGGSSCPTPGQPLTDTSNHRGSASLGASYTILPPKLNHYHILSQDNQRANSSPEIVSKSYPQSNIMSQGISSNKTCAIKNNPENGEVVSSSDYSPQQTRQSSGSKQNIIVSSERKLELANDHIVIPLGAEKDRKVHVDHLPVCRSSSAHSILDRDNESRRRDRDAESTHARPEGQQRKTHGHISRKSIGTKKTTPTSRTDHSEGRSDVPRSVTSLIDRFEKGTDVNHLNIGLLDISDKPPSMTSTPVVRRKNQGVSTAQPSHGKLAVVRSDGESSRSLSEGTKRSQSQKEISNMPGWQKGTAAREHQDGDHPARNNFSNSHHQTVNTHYFQPHPTENDRGHRSHAFLKPTQDYHVDGHHTRKPQQISDHHVTKQYQENDQNSSPRESYVIMYSGGQKQQPESHQYAISDSQPNSHASHVNTDEMLSKAQSSQVRPDIIKYSPLNPKHQTSSQSFMPKPVPQYPHHDLPETSSQHQHHFGSFTTSNAASNQPQAALSPGYDNLPQWHQQRHSPQVTYPSLAASQLQTPQPYSNISITPTRIQENVRHPQDFEGISRSLSSAFEPPSKPGTRYGRHPGAMAVVKPTVMNI